MAQPGMPAPATAQPPSPSASPEQRAGRSGARVLVVGGTGPVGRAVATRLAGLGHQLAVQGAGAIAMDAGRDDRPSDRADPAGVAPTLLPADRRDADAMSGVVPAACRALGGLDAVVILPAERPAAPPMSLHPDSWADAWSHVLAADVLAAACVAHAAAHLFRADPPTAGRIVLVTGGSGSGTPGGLPAVAADAAIAALGAELARDLDGQGVAVTVVCPRPEPADRVAGDVAETVTTLLSGPALPGMTVRLGG
jgi:NAD(P)-dependent dehydrogenase (short-subunit alcohol dehydrogenase family)